jgi:uncharacterized damage-inducible protein DinB
MSSTQKNPSILYALLDSWDRNNTILVNLLRAVPADALDARATPDSPSIARMFTHIHYVRLVFISEDAPEFAQPLPDEEWRDESNVDRIAQMLADSAKAVRETAEFRIKTSGQMIQHYDHPILFLQHMIWHEGYHHGQIKLALKAAGRGLPNQEIGPLTWGIWMDKT